jgi:endonuclease/exonuclease/phosphatase family metal-dependent hydrolase
MISLAVPTAASAHAVRPPAPSNIRVVRVSSSSFTVTAQSAGAHHYRVFAAQTRKALAMTTIARTAAKSPLTSSSTVTIRHLPYTTTPYYYRVEAINGNRGRFSTTIGSVGLLPAAPTGLRAVERPTGSYLTWSSGPATGFEVTQATSPDMTQGLTTYLTNGSDTDFAPTGLAPGTTYYFNVRALNGATQSVASSMVTMGSSTVEQPVSVMTYNVLEATNDGRVEGTQHIAPWSQRLPGAVALIRQANPDVIAVEEGSAYVDGSRTERQVDSLVSALGGTYALAYTEIPPPQPHYFRTGVYILYKPSVYQPVGTGDHWSIGQNRYAAYQTLQNIHTSAEFLMVATHLAVGASAALDNARKSETKTMLADAGAYAARSTLPVVYAGDYNSHSGTPGAIDGPGIAMREAGMTSAYDSAQTLTNAQYGSSNLYQRTAPVNGAHIDQIFTTPGVGVTSWNLILDLTNGQFVGAMPSDHNPLVADLLIPYAPVS